MLLQNSQLIREVPLGEVHEVVVGHVIIEILGRDTLEVLLDKPLQFRVVGIDGLDIERSVLMLTARNTDMGKPVLIGELRISPKTVRHQDGALFNPMVEDSLQVPDERPTKIRNFPDGQPFEVDRAKNAGFLFRNPTFLGFLAALMRSAGKFEIGLGMISFVRYGEIGFVRLRHAVNGHGIVHVLERVQDFMPPDEGSRHADFADVGAFPNGKLVHHAFKIFLPCREFLLGGEKNRVVRDGKGLFAVLAHITLYAALMSGLDDMDRTTMRATRAIWTLRVVVAENQLRKVAERLAVFLRPAFQVCNEISLLLIGQGFKHLLDNR